MVAGHVLEARARSISLGPAASSNKLVDCARTKVHGPETLKQELVTERVQVMIIYSEVGIIKLCT
jgi:hypothetical protein